METIAPNIRGRRTRRPRARPLTILDITDFYSDTASGGVKTYLREKMAFLEDAGISHAVVVPGARTGMEMQGLTRIHRIRGPRVPLSPAYRTLLSVREVARVLDRERPDVIEVGSPFLVPRLIRRATGHPAPATLGFYHADLVRTFAEPYLQHPAAAALRYALGAVARRMVRDVYGSFDLTVAASRSVVEELRTFGVGRVQEVPLGVDLERFRIRSPEDRASRAELGVPLDRPLGVFVGRFAPEKRLDVVLDGHARIPAPERPHLLLVGDGPQRSGLEERARSQEGLTLLPYQSSREEVARIYGTADFYLSPGPGETFGLSIAEALASGLPVVTVDRGAAPDRVAGAPVAELYRHEDTGDAARALADILPRLGPEMREAARRHAEENYDWSRTFSRMVELYESLATRTPRAP